MNARKEVLEINGAYGEGGGQIIRTSVGLSALTGKPVRIDRIRDNRSPSGLRPQHCKAVRSVQRFCNAEVDGDYQNSDELVFRPKNLRLQSLDVNIETAGSVHLLLQSLLLPAVEANRTITLEVTGGTHVRWSPGYEYFRNVFCFYLNQLGIRVEPEILQHGFYPRGGGTVRVTVQPGTISCPNFLDPGDLEKVSGCSIASNHLEDSSVAHRQMRGAEEQLSEEFSLEDTEVAYEFSFSPGAHIHLLAEYENARLSGDVLAEKGRPAERVGQEASRQLLDRMEKYHCLGPHMQDQIIPFMGYAVSRCEKKMEFRSGPVLRHTSTVVHVTEQFLPVSFDVSEAKISCAPM